jgi:four helix bundle protein
LAEGCGRRSDGEMARFIPISMGSGSELSYHLLLARDRIS